MFQKRLIEALRSLDLPVTEVESIPAVGLLNPTILTALLLDFIDLLPPDRHARILQQEPLVAFLDNRRLVSALDFLYLYNCLVSSRTSLEPVLSHSNVGLITTVRDLYGLFRPFLTMICRLLENITAFNALASSKSVVGTMHGGADAVQDVLGLSPLFYCPKSGSGTQSDVITAFIADGIDGPDRSVLDYGEKATIPASNLPIFKFGKDEIDTFPFREYEELPLNLETYIYEINLAVLRRVGVCYAPHDINYSFHLTTDISTTNVVQTRGTYFVPLHNPAPIILQPEPSEFDRLEPELVELALQNMPSSSESSSDGDDRGYHNRDIMGSDGGQMDAHARQTSNMSTTPLSVSAIKDSVIHIDGSSTGTYGTQAQGQQHDRAQVKTGGVTVSLSSAPESGGKWLVINNSGNDDEVGDDLEGKNRHQGQDLNQDQDHHAMFSHLSSMGVDKVYDASPSNSQHNSFRASMEETKSHSHSQSQSTSNTSGMYQYNSDEEDDLPPSRVKFNKFVEVDPGRYYKLKPFDEMQDILSSTALINNMSFQINELEKKVSSLLADNVQLTTRLNLAASEHEHEKAALNTALGEAHQKIKVLESRLLSMELEQTSKAYFSRQHQQQQVTVSTPSNNFAQQLQYKPSSESDIEYVPRSLTANLPRGHRRPQISFSPAPSEPSMRTDRKSTGPVYVTAVLPKTVDTSGVTAPPTAASEGYAGPTHEIYREVSDKPLDIKDLAVASTRQTPPAESSALSTPQQHNLHFNSNNYHMGYQPGEFANIQRINITPLKSGDRRHRRTGSLNTDGPVSQPPASAKKSKKQRHFSQGRERKSSPTGSTINDSLVKDVLEDIIHTQLNNKWNLIAGANQVKAETFSAQLRSMSLERDAPMKPPGSPTSSVRKLRHVSSAVHRQVSATRQ